MQRKAGQRFVGKGAVVDKEKENNVARDRNVSVRGFGAGGDSLFGGGGGSKACDRLCSQGEESKARRSMGYGSPVKRNGVSPTGNNVFLFPTIRPRQRACQ